MIRTKYKTIALIFQGGGSLGAYHIGIYKALEEQGYLPDILAGISIGAFTASLIAGNEPKERLEKLVDFWNTICWPDLPPFSHAADPMKMLHHKMTSLQGVLFGQPNFFIPRFPGPQLQPKGTTASTSYYDTSKLKQTLLKFIDFDRLKARKNRLILGATRVKDGEQVFFDNENMVIKPEHIMASGAMPPGFPAVRVDGDLYWDGGCVFNTPLEAVFKSNTKTDTLVFMVDLFTPNGEEPLDMEEVNIRSKDILYASRTAHHIDHVQERHNLAFALHQALEGTSPSKTERSSSPTTKTLSSSHLFDIVHLIYDAPHHKVSSKAYEFSKSSVQERLQHGYQDTLQVLNKHPWLQENKLPKGSQVYKFLSGKAA
jgi:NTE family protein